MLWYIIGGFILLGYFIKEQKDSIDNRLDAIERRLIGNEEEKSFYDGEYLGDDDESTD